MRMGLKVTGLKELQKALLDKERTHDKAVKKIVRHHGAELQRVMMRNAIFVKGYSHGDTQRSITFEITQGGFTAVVGPTTDYSPYLEYGTRYMQAQPFVHKSVDEQKVKFFNDLKKLVE